MLTVLLALAPMMSIGTPTPGGGGRFGQVNVLAEFKNALFAAQSDPYEAIEVPDTAPVLGGGSATNYCQATPHSFGGPAAITWMGSLDLSTNTFGLKTSALPPVTASFGMFTYGQVQTNVPFANGFLCISPFNPGIFRMRMQHLTASGNVLNSIAATPHEYTAFTPGSNWNFQFWYRNPQAGGAKFNLSNGLNVTFAP
jgi:hypothetical protein